jgi:hypothetical protein
MKESRVVRARSRLRCGDGNYFYEPALGFLTSLGLLCPGLDQKVVPEALFAAPFRKKAPHPWAYAQGGSSSHPTTLRRCGQAAVQISGGLRSDIRDLPSLHPPC